MSDQPTKEWRCFHCDEVFTDAEEAMLHFGDNPFDPVACGVDAAELRQLQRELAAYQQEDTQLHREIAALHGKIATLERRAEEAGYAKGLADAQKYPETLGLKASNMELAG